MYTMKISYNNFSVSGDLIREKESERTEIFDLGLDALLNMATILGRQTLGSEQGALQHSPNLNCCYSQSHLSVNSFCVTEKKQLLTVPPILRIFNSPFL